MTTQEIEKTIIQAFDKTPMPKGKLTDTYDDEGAQEYFSNTKWNEHSAKNLRIHEAAMCFFTPEAFRYYLPAYMLAELHDPEEADILGEYVVYQFSMPDKNWDGILKERLSLFSSEEKNAILEFIKYMQNVYDCFEKDLEYATKVLSS